MTKPTTAPSPATVPFGGGSIPLDSSPLSARDAVRTRGVYFSMNVRDAVLLQPYPSRLVLRLRALARLFWLALVTLTAALCFLAAIGLPLAANNLPPAWWGRALRWAIDAFLPVGPLLVAGAVLLLALPVLAWGNPVVFDRAGGRMTYYGFWTRTDRPLQDILAVQLIPGEVHRLPGEEGGTYQSCQLNVILADPQRPRLNLTDHADLAWTRQAGRQLAGFLQVPFLDQIPGRVACSSLTA